VYFTEKQLRIMKFIQDFRSSRGISPTMEEIAEEIGVTKITIYDHLNQLERKGALRRERFRARSIEPLVWVGEKQNRLVLPYIGAVECEAPLPDRQVDEVLDLASLFPLNDRSFVLRVKGSGLDGEAISGGDYLLLEKRSSSRNGDLVLGVLPDGRAILARYFREKGRVRLESPGTDGKRPPIRVREVHVKGVVIGVLRTFQRPEEN
jgi:repressor LexA